MKAISKQLDISPGSLQNQILRFATQCVQAGYAPKNTPHLECISIRAMRNNRDMWLIAFTKLRQRKLTKGY
jgi:hypothetical protein